MERRPGGLHKFLPTDREECGVLVTNEEGLTYILKVPNRAERNEDYAIYMDDVEKIKEVLSAGEQITGFFHTHLAHHKCEPTDADLDGASLTPGTNNLIYKPDTKELCWYGEEVEN